MKNEIAFETATDLVSCDQISVIESFGFKGVGVKNVNSVIKKLNDIDNAYSKAIKALQNQFVYENLDKLNNKKELIEEKLSKASKNVNDNESELITDDEELLLEIDSILTKIELSDVTDNKDISFEVLSGSYLINKEDPILKSINELIESREYDKDDLLEEEIDSSSKLNDDYDPNGNKTKLLFSGMIGDDIYELTVDYNTEDGVNRYLEEWKKNGVLHRYGGGPAQISIVSHDDEEDSQYMDFFVKTYSIDGKVIKSIDEFFFPGMFDEIKEKLTAGKVDMEALIINSAINNDDAEFSV